MVSNPNPKVVRVMVSNPKAVRVRVRVGVSNPKVVRVRLGYIILLHIHENVQNFLKIYRQLTEKSKNLIQSIRHIDIPQKASCMQLPILNSD